MTARPDEIGTGTAAALIGVSGEMLRRVIKAGHVPVHRRGFTTVQAAVQGYAQFLRLEAQRAEANASAVRAHQAKAATVTASNARRRAGLIDRTDVEVAVAGIAAIACDQLSRLAVTGLIPGTTERVAEEARLAMADIRAAYEQAVKILRGEASHDG